MKKISDTPKNQIGDLNQELILLKEERNKLNVEAKKWADKRNALHEKIRTLRKDTSVIKEKRDNLNKQVQELKNIRDNLKGKVIEKRKSEVARIIAESYYNLKQYKEALPYYEAFSKYKKKIGLILPENLLLVEEVKAVAGNYVWIKFRRILN